MRLLGKLKDMGMHPVARFLLALAIGVALGGVSTLLLRDRTPGTFVDAPREPGVVASGEDEDHEEGLVHLSPAQLEGLSLQAVAVRRGSVEDAVDLPAEVSWNTDRLVHVNPRVTGIVSAVEKTLGDLVNPGDLLCVLDSREMGDAKMNYLSGLSKFGVAEADFERARVVYENTRRLLEILDATPPPEDALTQAGDLPVGDNKNKLLTTYTRMRVNETNFERTKGLVEKRIASEVDYLDAKGDFEISRADYLSTREEITFDLKLKFLRAERDFKVAQTELRNSDRALHILGLAQKEIDALRAGREQVDDEISRSPIYSPGSGVIADRHVTQGEVARNDSTLYTIADPSDVWVLGRVYEKDLRRLKEGQKATVRLDAFPGESFEGSVDYIGSQLDPKTRTVEARVVLPNSGRRLRPGMFGTMTVFTEHHEEGRKGNGAYLVPVSALQRVGNNSVVYLRVSPGEFRQVPVQVIASSREFAEVTGEIEDGAMVAAGDTFVLKSEAGKEEMGGGHGH